MSTPLGPRAGIPGKRHGLRRDTCSRFARGFSLGRFRQSTPRNYSHGDGRHTRRLFRLRPLDVRVCGSRRGGWSVVAHVRDRPGCGVGGKRRTLGLRGLVSVVPHGGSHEVPDRSRDVGRSRTIGAAMMPDPSNVQTREESVTARPCEGCGRIPGGRRRRHARFCSGRCRVAAHRARRREVPR